jgi:hypothetical protein
MPDQVDGQWITYCVKTEHCSNLFTRAYLLLVLLMANDGGELHLAFMFGWPCISNYIRIMNQHDALLFTLFSYHACTCFGLFLAHHQEAKCIMWQRYFFYCLRAWMWRNCISFSSRPVDSRFKIKLSTTATLHTWPPDDGLKIAWNMYSHDNEIK